MITVSFMAMTIGTLMFLISRVLILNWKLKEDRYASSVLRDRLCILEMRLLGRLDIRDTGEVLK